MKPTPLYRLINKRKWKDPIFYYQAGKIKLTMHEQSSLFDNLTLDTSFYLAAMFLDVSQFGLLLVVAIFFLINILLMALEYKFF